ncbi:MAG: iron ABC transporter permease [Natronospirillum sp.]
MVLRVWRERIALRLLVRPLIALVLLLATLGLVVAISLTVGSYHIALPDVWRVLSGAEQHQQMMVVVWEFRFPRTLAAALVGGMFALSGSALQSVTRNGLADPSLVGISQGAGLAVVLLVVLWPDAVGAWRPWVALMGSLSVAALIQTLSWRRDGNNSMRFILMGIGVAAFISAITSALMTYGQIDRAMSALAWLSGSVNAANWHDVRMLALWAGILVPLLLVLSRPMAAQNLGDDMALGLGVPMTWVRRGLIIVAVALAAIATAVVGPIAFVGLIAPHAARRLAHAGMGMHLLLAASLGALLVALADLLGRALFAPIQIPAGLVTSLIGVPLFIVLMYRTQARGGQA